MLPGFFMFLTAPALPAGVRAIVVALVPIFVLPMALALGLSAPTRGGPRGRPRRGGGGDGRASGRAARGRRYRDAAARADLAALLRVEASYLAWRRPHGLHPFEVLFGASLVSIALTWPFAVATGQMVHPTGWGRPEWAMLAVGVLNAGAYSGYVWLIGAAGSVFASQIAYLVTGFGVAWSMLLLGERYPPPVWVAFALILAATALVQPREG